MRASPSAESSSLRGATRTRMRHARSLPIAQATARLRHVLALASRLLARGSPGPTLPLGAERTVLVRSTSSGSVGGAAPCARRQAAVQHIYLSSRQAQAPLAKRGLRDESPLELLVGVLYKRNPL